MRQAGLKIKMRVPHWTYKPQFSFPETVSMTLGADGLMIDTGVRGIDQDDAAAIARFMLSEP